MIGLENSLLNKQQNNVYTKLKLIITVKCVINDWNMDNSCPEFLDRSQYDEKATV